MQDTQWAMIQHSNRNKLSCLLIWEDSQLWIQHLLISQTWGDWVYPYRSRENCVFPLRCMLKNKQISTQLFPVSAIFRPYEHACCQPLTLMGPKPLACPQAIVSYLLKATFKGVGLTPPQKNIVIVFTNVLKCMSECVGSLCEPCHYVFCTTSHMFRGQGACRTEITCHSHPLPQPALFFFIN